MFRRGCIELIIGGMRVGKTAQGLERLKQESFAKGRKAMIFIPRGSDREVELDS